MVLKCALAFYLMILVSLKYNIVVYRAVGALLHRKYVVDVLNAIYNRFLRKQLKSL